MWLRDYVPSLPALSPKSTWLLCGAATTCAAAALLLRHRRSGRDARQAVADVPVEPSRIPFIGSALSFASNPRQYLQAMRQKHGDTFMLDLFGARLLFVFSARGVRSLYQLPESLQYGCLLW